jgi:hypothetical protein
MPSPRYCIESNSIADSIKGYKGIISQGGYRNQYSRSVSQDRYLSIGAGQSGILFVQLGPSTKFNTPTG